MLYEELNTATLRCGYELGCFPMMVEDGTIQWFHSPMRCLLPIGGIHVSHSLRKVIRQNRFTIKFNVDFEEVMRGCLRPSANWINEELVRVFTKAHAEQWAHCCGVYQEGQLVGGVYGLCLGRVFCAESMFHRVTNASKVALYNMVVFARGHGCDVFDAQIMNPHLASLGAYEVSQQEYKMMLERGMTDPAILDGYQRRKRSFAPYARGSGLHVYEAD